jgi:uncharacterized lipoprotein YddW (UPF0748 family)
MGCFFLLLGVPIKIDAQVQAGPKRELRGVWVASVANIDYPVRPTTDTASLKREWTALLDNFERAGLNAVIVQVRPAADALYPSALAPWSKYLTGQQGNAPLGGWDPLGFMIETAHRRNFEFHAWLNPYRATNDLDTAGLSPDHLFNTHRDWILKYGSKFYLNPSLPEVRAHLVEVVEELIKRYPLDAIHMDDYFYPYRITGEDFPDAADFARLGAGFANVDDWRRHNVDTLIETLHTRIKNLRPTVEFGISPFSVWRNQDKDPEGSPTRAGQTNYDDLFADIRKWLRKGWIDYVAPQLYFHIGFELVDYEKTLKWWYDNANGAKLYIGMAAYRVGSDRYPEWLEPDQIPRQLRINRSMDKVHGHIFFSAKQLLKNPLGLTDSLSNAYFAAPALLPLRKGHSLEPLRPPVLKTVHKTKVGMELVWKNTIPAASPGYWVVYRFPEGVGPDIARPGSILHIIPASRPHGKVTFLDVHGEKGKRYHYLLTSLDKYYTESSPSNIVKSKRFSK